MRLDGKQLANDILKRLAKDVSDLKQSGITPALAVILVGDNPASLAYIRQKQKAAETIGARVLLNTYPADADPLLIKTVIRECNADPAVHGLIVQRPLPEALGDMSEILTSVARKKDVDGFLPDSPYPVPVAAAVWEIISSTGKPPTNAVVIGRGETAGKPIYEYLLKKDISVTQVHSRTQKPEEIIKKSDVIISCVGKERVLRRKDIKPGAILVGVGIWRDGHGKLRGDYDEEEIADIAGAYTPTPGGVGPVNVACLMQNVILSAQKQT